MQLTFKNISVLAMLAFAFIFSSCEKEPIQPASAPFQLAALEGDEEEPDCDFDALIPAVVSDGEMLPFDDWETVFATAHCLEVLVEDHIEAFAESLGEVSEEEYNILAEEMAFD